MIERAFWDGIDALHIMFEAIGSLSDGPDRGAVWQFDIVTRTRLRVGTGSAYSWPVQGLDAGDIVALQGSQIVKISTDAEEALGKPSPWRKLVGVAPNGMLIGILQLAEGAQPALMTREGTLTVLPPAQSAADQERVAMLLQEDRVYSGNRRLVVARSERGGRGYDVYYIVAGERLNISDCGDDSCGQPALAADGRHVTYVRSVD
jgi:hypothetical protein